MIRNLLCATMLIACLGCKKGHNKEVAEKTQQEEKVQFEWLSTIKVGDANTTEISAYSIKTKKLFIANTLEKEISVYDISNPKKGRKLKSIHIDAYGGNVNSVAVHGWRLAAAIEAKHKQDSGKIVVFNVHSQKMIEAYTVGALPDMVCFTPDGRYLLSANEGEPNDTYTEDPEGSISIVDLEKNTVANVNFAQWESRAEALKNGGLRIFGKNANLAQDIEPEYLTISDDSKRAWVTLQENNAIAEIDILNKKVANIFPLGTKDFSLLRNKLDVSDADDSLQLRNWPVKGFYLPDAIDHIMYRGNEFIITANEGDARAYKGFSEENRVGLITLDKKRFPNRKELQKDYNLGRLKISTTVGDIDNDGDFDELYAFGGRSFSIWTTKGELVYDSGDDFAKHTIANKRSFNQGDTRSDDKGSEPEALEVLDIQGKKVLFVGLERTGGILVYDITNPKLPVFMHWLDHGGDISPEGLVVLSAEESPSGKELLIVTNEISGTVTLYQNQ